MTATGRRVGFVVLTLLVAVAIHVDWHFARPAHHRLSLDWPYHWLTGIPIGVIVGLSSARLFPHAAYRAALGVVLLGSLIGHIIEPLLEAVLFEQRLAYPVEAERWLAFVTFTAVTATALFITLRVWLARSRGSA